jgi:uncharacterized membrane protein YGL010W
VEERDFNTFHSQKNVKRHVIGIILILIHQNETFHICAMLPEGAVQSRVSNILRILTKEHAVYYMGSNSSSGNVSFSN